MKASEPKTREELPFLGKRDESKVIVVNRIPGGKPGTKPFKVHRKTLQAYEIIPQGMQIKGKERLAEEYNSEYFYTNAPNKKVAVKNMLKGLQRKDSKKKITNTEMNDIIEKANERFRAYSLAQAGGSPNR